MEPEIRGTNKRQRNHKQRPNPSFDGVKFIIAYRQQLTTVKKWAWPYIIII